MPPTCAIASRISTAGMIGRPGKWPWKNGSLIVTFLMPSTDRPSSMLRDAVDEQERIAVRQQFHDRGDVPLLAAKRRAAGPGAAALRAGASRTRRGTGARPQRADVPEHRADDAMVPAAACWAGFRIACSGKTWEGARSGCPEAAVGDRRDLTKHHRPRGDVPAASASAWVARACRWGRRNPVCPLCCVAEGEPDIRVHPGRRRQVEGVPGPQRQPGPRAGFVARQEHQITRAGRLFGHVPDCLLQPGNLIRGARCVARPGAAPRPTSISRHR